MPWKGLFLTKKLIFSTSINPEVYRRNEHNETVRCLCSWFFFFFNISHQKDLYKLEKETSSGLSFNKAGKSRLNMYNFISSRV